MVGKLLPLLDHALCVYNYDASAFLFLDAD